MLYVIEYQVSLADQPRYTGPFRSWEIETATKQWQYVLARALSRRYDKHLGGFVNSSHLEEAQKRMSVLEVDESQLPKHMLPPDQTTMH